MEFPALYTGIGLFSKVLVTAGEHFNPADDLFAHAIEFGLDAAQCIREAGIDFFEAVEQCWVIAGRHAAAAFNAHALRIAKGWNDLSKLSRNRAKRSCKLAKDRKTLRHILNRAMDGFDL